MEKTISIKNNGHLIPAIINEVEKDNYPMVILLHGFGSDKNEVNHGFVKMANKLNENGIGSVRIDFVGCGESESSFVNFNLEVAISDVLATIEYLKVNYPSINKIGVIGWSQGGSIAMLVGALTNEIEALVTWAGAIDLSVLCSDLEYQQAQEVGFVNKSFDWRNDLKLSFQYCQELRSIKILDSVRNISQKILAINGELDDVVKKIAVERILENCLNHQSEGLIIKNADHIFRIFDCPGMYEELMDVTCDWLKDALT